MIFLKRSFFVLTFSILFSIGTSSASEKILDEEAEERTRLLELFLWETKTFAPNTEVIYLPEKLLEAPVLKKSFYPIPGEQFEKTFADNVEDFISLKFLLLPGYSL